MSPPSCLFCSGEEQKVFSSAASTQTNDLRSDSVFSSLVMPLLQRATWAASFISSVVSPDLQKGAGLTCCNTNNYCRIQSTESIFRLHKTVLFLTAYAVALLVQQVAREQFICNMPISEVSSPNRIKRFSHVVILPKDAKVMKLTTKTISSSKV